MKNKLAFIAAALMSVQCIYPALAHACGAGQCTKDLTLVGLCSPSYGSTDVWQLTNLSTTGPSANDNAGCAGLHYTALIPGSTYETTGCVPTNSSVTITAPAGGTNDLQIYVDGTVIVSDTAQAQCDCAGTPAGTATLNACGICNGGTQGIGCDGQCDTKTVDACGVCGGGETTCSAPGTTESCTQEAASVQSVTTAAVTTKTVTQLYNRIPEFAGRAVACDSSVAKLVPTWEKKGLALKSEITALLAAKITESTLSCPGAECVAVSTKATRSTLRSYINKLGTLAKNVKLEAISACRVPKRTLPDDPDAHDTAYYLNRALTAVSKLPQTGTQCTSK